MPCPHRGPECGGEDRKERGRLVRRRLAHCEDDGRDHHGQEHVFLGRSTTRDSFAHSADEAPGRFLEDRLTLPRRESSERVLSRSEEHTSELQSLRHLVCRLLLEKKKED